MQTCVPYSYDLLSRKESVSTIDRTVVFLTSQGVVQIAGGRSLLLAANPAASTGFVNDVQPDVVRAMLCAQADGALPPDLGSLTDYLTTGGQTVYDYAHGRMVLFNPAYAYCYLYSFGENSWTIVMRQYTHALNGYDNCLLVNKREVAEKETGEDGTEKAVTNTYWDVWDYSQNNFVEAVSGYVMTRPMKLDYPDVLKTVQTVIQRGMFCKGKIDQALYGSRDNVNWERIAYSQSEFLRGVRGTGYKYYMIVASFRDFTQRENLVGASVEFVKRETDLMR